MKKGVKAMVGRVCGRRHGAAISSAGVLVASIMLAAMLVRPAAADFSGFNDKLEKALAGDWGKISFNVRWRFEYVEQEGKKTATGDPIRLRLGYMTPEWYNLQGFAEFEGNTPVFSNNYNSLRNDKTRYAVIADPAEAEVNQLWLAFSGIPKSAIKVGRQKIVYNNHRFIGNVGWRQMEQTFDAAGFVNRSIGNLEANFAYLNNVRNVLSEDVHMSSLILNLGYQFGSIGKLTLYGYWLDYDDADDSGPFPFAFSTQTYGIRFNGSRSVAENLDLIYTAEYAYQADYKKNPRDYSANYFHFIGGIKIPEVAAGCSDVVAKFGWEYLGSDKDTALQTPLGTNHAFQGWADQFLVTPPAGMVDWYGALGATVMGLDILAVYHKFDAAAGNSTYGHEIDAQVVKKFGKHYSLLAAYANYFAEDFKTDTQKFWLQAVADF